MRAASPTHRSPLPAYDSTQPAPRLPSPSTRVACPAIADPDFDYSWKGTLEGPIIFAHSHTPLQYSTSLRAEPHHTPKKQSWLRGFARASDTPTHPPRTSSLSQLAHAHSATRCTAIGVLLAVPTPVSRPAIRRNTSPPTFWAHYSLLICLYPVSIGSPTGASRLGTFVIRLGPSFIPSPSTTSTNFFRRRLPPPIFARSTSRPAYQS